MSLAESNVISIFPSLVKTQGMQMTRTPERLSVRKTPLCDVIERVTAHSSASTSARWLFAGCLLSSASNVAALATYVVNTTGDPGPAGTTSLRQALITAEMSADSIVLFDDSLRDSTITLTQGAIVLGARHNLYVEGPGSGHLTIAGSGLAPVIVFDSYIAGPLLSMAGMTIKNGHVSSGYPLFGGGCLAVKYSTLGLNDVVVTGCSADRYGGGIFLMSSNLSMLRSTISGNSSGMGGGGIQVQKSGEQGSLNSNVYIYDSTVSNNTTYGYGAGIAVSGTDHVRINRSLISGNTVYSSPNSAAGGGGIALKTIYQQALIVNSTIADNLTYDAGGGIGLFDAMSSQVTQVQFSTISQNYGGFGRGGNGIHATAGFSIDSSIIANNFNRYSNVDIDATVAATHSLILNIGSAQVSGQNNIFGVDPRLGKLSFNGGPTMTMLPNAGSPVIDQGGNPGTINKDQRGLPRTVGPSTDMGAVERQLIEDEIFRDGFDSS